MLGAGVTFDGSQILHPGRYFKAPNNVLEEFLKIDLDCRTRTVVIERILSVATPLVTSGWAACWAGRARLPLRAATLSIAVPVGRALLRRQAIYIVVPMK